MEDRKTAAKRYLLGMTQSLQTCTQSCCVAYTGPVNISISRLLLSIAYSALLLHDGKLQLLFTQASPQVIKLHHRIRAVTSLGDQNSHLHWNLMRPPSYTVHHWPKRCYVLHHLIYFCPALNWGDTGVEEKELHFSVLCPALWILCYHSQDKHNFILESQLFCNRKSLLG